MIKKLIWISLIAAAVLMSAAIPSAQGGKWLSYDTPWTISCTGNVAGSLDLTTHKGLLGSFYPIGCSSNGTNTTTPTTTVHTAGGTAPTNWTWNMAGCFDIHQRSPISGKVGQQIPYNCFTSTGGLLSTGSVFVGQPVGSTSP